MSLNDIGFYTLRDFRCQQASSSSRLYRAEILLTDRCNFKCPYCRGLDKKLQGDKDYASVVKILDWMFTQNLKNVRFSGGEPTLYEKLPDLVDLCRRNNVDRIAISTNGSASLEYYKNLINLGVSDFSISLDACCSSVADIMSGAPHTYSNVVNNIRELSKLTYVTVGIVYNDINENEVRNTIKGAKALGVADIRIIPAAQYNNTSILKQIPKDSTYRILSYRLNNIKKGRRIRGLSGDDNPKCPLVLDDMAIAGNYHYPCIIYLREGGVPIGSMLNECTDKPYDIRETRRIWYENHDCFSDRICTRNCLDVCVDYNNAWRHFEQSRKYCYNKFKV